MNNIIATLKKSLSAALIISAGSNAYATFIVGEIAFTGDITPLSGGASVSLDSADTLTFGTVNTLVATGSFSSIPFYSPAVFSDIVLPPATGSISALWSVGDFTFDLDSLKTTQHDASGLILKGIGTIKGLGFDDTLGTFNFSANPKGGGTFNMSAGTAPVPEPSNIVLFAMGLCGFAFIGYKRRTAA